MTFFTLTAWLATVEFFFGGNKDPFVECYLYIIPLVLLIVNLIEENLWKKLK